jgi:large subunit ribosomal protein L21
MNAERTYAVIRAGGTQVRVAAGETIRVPSLAGEPGAEVTFPDVLLLSAEGRVEVGKPTVPGAKVTAEILRHGRGKRVRVVKFKRKKGYLRVQGHRQGFTSVKIKAIVQN